MFILIVSVGVVGILSVMNVTTQASADPMLRKQALSIAESLLDEIQAQPFTFCDPSDPDVGTAGSVGECAIAQQYGPQAGESRSGLAPATRPFNNVLDYGGPASGNPGFSMTGIRDVNDNPIPGLDNYTATVTITDAAVGTVPVDASLRIDVRVTSGASVDVTLTGYRMRYAPNAGS